MGEAHVALDDVQKRIRETKSGDRIGAELMVAYALLRALLLEGDIDDVKQCEVCRDHDIRLK